MNKYILAFVGILLLSTLALKAQLDFENTSIDALNKLGYNPVVRIYDQEGNEQHPYDITVPQTDSKKTGQSKSAPQNNTCNAGIFELFFEGVIDNTGVGFDNGVTYSGSGSGSTFPTGATIGQVRQQVICQVFSDLSDFLGFPAVSVANPTVRVAIPQSLNFNGSKMGEAGSYYLIPNGTTGAMLDGEVWKTINLGVDSWTTLPNELLNMFPAFKNSTGEFYHGYVQLYFDPTNPGSIFHYDYNSPNTNNILNDFYSLILHEATHMLGFGSLLKADGFSRLQGGGFFPGCAQCYTRYDGHLWSTNTGTAVELINDADPLDPTLPMASTFPGCGTPILFSGFNHTNQEVFSPSNFLTGGSLSHFECSCPTSSGYSGAMLACSSPGTSQRFLNQAEVNALCDLGYARTNSWAVDGIIVTSYTSCTNTPCLAIGANDFSDQSNVQYTTDNVAPITITNILDNDIFPGGSTPTILNNNIQILQGGGSSLLVGNNLTYIPDPNFTGWVILAYNPTCPGSLMVGNPTYIFIRVNAQLPPCDQTDCNLICTGNLEADNSDFYINDVAFSSNLNFAQFYTLSGGNINSSFLWASIPLSTIQPINTNGTIPVRDIVGHCSGIIDIEGVPPLSTSAFSTTNNSFARISTSKPTNQIQSGIQLRLIRPLDPSETYTLSFWAINPDSCIFSHTGFPAPKADTPIVYIYGTDDANPCFNPVPLSNTLGNIATQTGSACNTQLIGKSNAIPVLPDNINGAKEWNQYFITIDPANMTNAYNRLYITLQDVASIYTGLGQTGQKIALLVDEFVLTQNNSTALSINTTSPTLFPCINNNGNMDLVTIDYEVCIDDILQVPNAGDISLQVDLSGFSVVSGPFSSTGVLTIPAGSQTTQCTTYSITLAATVPNTIQPGVAINFPIVLTSLGSSCMNGNSSSNTVDILPVQSLPLSLTKSVSAAPHIIGQALTYTIEVCNPLPVAQNNLSLSDVLNSVELSFNASNSPDFPSIATTGGNLTVRTPLFNLPAANGPGNPACTTFTFEATPLVGMANCSSIPVSIPNQATLAQLGSQCPAVVSNIVNISPVVSVVIPAGISTLTQAINAGFLLPMPQALSISQFVSIEDGLVMDVGVNGSNVNYTFANGSEITMYPEAEIVIPMDQNANFYGTHIHGCSNMWKRILVQTGGQISIAKGSLIEGGEHAIEFEDKAVYFISHSTFRNNYIGLYTAPSNSPNKCGGFIRSVTFEGTGSLLAVYSGQTTLPDTWPYAGIQFNNTLSLDLDEGNANVFQNLAIGIEVNQTNLTINRAAVFQNMQLVQSYSLFTKTGVFSRSITNLHELYIEGYGSSSSSTISFSDCKYGILIMGQIDYTIINNFIKADHIPTVAQGSNPIGIVAASCINRKGRILNNRLISSDVGIGLFNNDAPNSDIEISGNDITMVKGANFGGITVYEGGLDYSLLIKNNTINLFDARKGIELLGQSGGVIEENQVKLHNDIPAGVLGYIGYWNRTGIEVEGCNFQTVSCNNMLGGVGSSSLSDFSAYNFAPYNNGAYNNNNENVFGIRSLNSTDNSYTCNQFDLIPNGIQFSGTSANSTVKGNSFNRVGRGLWLTNSAIIGQHIHQGNMWNWAPTSSTFTNPVSA
ncbi:MAG: DUF11 domain-containing protein, partial [Flavobacteriales bacterium]|nr:DUF11 domain-containing protein [Flavobacteriales bacterium]